MNGPIAPALEGMDDNGWHKEETWAMDAASSGSCGDDAIGTFFEARYWKGLGDEFMVVEESYFVVPFENGDPGFDVYGMYTFTVCTDKDDAGGTEQWSDIQYEKDLHASGFHTVESAEHFARSIALSDQRPTLNWDGGIPASRY